MAEQYLSDEQLGERYGVSRVSIWRWHRERPDFPRVIKLTPGCARWRLSEIEEWERAKAEGSSRKISRTYREQSKELTLN